MWKDYVSGCIRNNRSSGLSIRISAFISALFLSLLCSLFYNLWKYEIERIELEEGNWHSRIVGEMDPETVEIIRNFVGIKEVMFKEEAGMQTVTELRFQHMGRVLEDTPRIAELAGLASDAVSYHHGLLALYLVRDPEDPKPRLLFPMFLMILVMASASLIVIIHNSFAVSMNARIHQFGIFSSIGATPRQIRTCLLQEAAVLCAVPVLVGNLLGILAVMGCLHLSNLLGSGTPGRHEAVFGFHPLVLCLTLSVTVLTIWISAWLPAGRLSRLTPLEAVRHTDERKLKRRKNSLVLSCLFGVEGELAGSALKAQEKSLRTASLALILSFLAFTVMQCFFTLSKISTRETYFERYQNAWDLMITVKDTRIESFDKTDAVQELEEVRSAVVYQKAMAECLITEENLSEELRDLGGFSYASGTEAVQVDGGWLVQASIVILDDSSFLAYCEQIGIRPQLTGAVIRNQIQDVTNPDFRHPRYMPYIKGKEEVSLSGPSGEGIPSVEIPVLACTEKVPVLREEYASLNPYELVHFLPVSLWEEIREQIGGAEEDTLIRILGREGITPEELSALQQRADQITAGIWTSEIENRIQEQENNDQQIFGLKVIFGGMCVLLALIGIGNVFSGTLGFVRQRKREIARYLSVGLTPEGVRKIFCIEALALAGRPVLITLPLTILATGYMLKLSYMDVGEFLVEAPFFSILLFLLAILGAVALAYGLGWRNICRMSLPEMLRDDTMM